MLPSGAGVFEALWMSSLRSMSGLGAGVFEGPGQTGHYFSIPAFQLDPNILDWNCSWQIPIFQGSIKIENNE